MEAAKVNFPFGYGLSFTRFEYGAFTVEPISGDSQKRFRISARLANIGDVGGGELVQVYAGTAIARDEHPIKQLVAFKKVHLQAGGAEEVELEFEARDFAFWDEKQSRWAVDGGGYTISLASSAADVIASTLVRI